MTTENHKRPYQAPEIVELGPVEELTKGTGLGGADWLIFGETAPGGNCFRRTCAGSA